MDQLIESYTKTAKFIGGNGTKLEISDSVARLLECSRNCCSHKFLNGKDPESRALVWQWLEQCAILDRNFSENLAKRLNLELEDHVFIVGNEFTVVDIVYYYLLEQYIRDSTHHLRQTLLPNISRWFDHIQRMEGIAKDQKKITFLKNAIYT